MFCLEYLLKNVDWLIEKLKPIQGWYAYSLCRKLNRQNCVEHYIIFDFPGQVELFTHHTAVKELLETLTKMDYRVCTKYMRCSSSLLFIACVSAHGRRTLLHGSIQIHFSTLAFAQDYDSAGITSCQCVIKGGPDRILWEITYVLVMFACFFFIDGY